MKLWKKVASFLIILPALALNACGAALQYQVPPLNDHDRERLTCSDYPDFEAMLTALPDHEWLSTTSGEVVVTPDGRRWVSFDVVQKREERLLKFTLIDTRGAHFECFDDLRWLARVWGELEAKQ